ncbi:hypothetical protein V6N11_033289 [Hibiscus sabdariffa]|uniref:Leucine-rich repeat-containing N-terminal plant-type domain-containing protein n=1 Tax=Hibiscus sabdariffa TaxID=183260 RepID=A0ABR2PXL8_9ROSI
MLLMGTSLFSRLLLNSFVAVFFFLVTAVLVSGQCESHQQVLLLRLKESLNSSLSLKLGNWNPSTDCCSWGGITCDGSGRVIGLDLSSQSISGAVDGSNSLFHLRHLQQLNLAYNRLDFSFPSGFHKFPNLSCLNLSNSGFKGQIPAEISRLGSLVTLDLSVSSFVSIESPLKLENPNLRMLVQNLTRLRSLHLDGVKISARGKEWCRALSSVPNLQVLSMSNCDLSGPIDDSLQNLKNLSVIHLDRNKLSAVVPAFLAQLSNLTSLRLSGCGLHGRFPSEILQVRTLQSLEITDNGELHGHLPEFHHNCSLRILVLSRTKFFGSLPSSISNLDQLVYLDLSFNNFAGQVPPLDMSKNLAYLDLSHNKLSGKVESFKWEDLQNLTHTDLSYNSLHGRIPSSLVALPSIELVQLSNNQFDGELIGFPKVRQSLLNILDLSNNQLQGSIPANVFELDRLKVLSLSSNKFNGTVWLGDVQKLVNLTVLDLSHNNLYVTATPSYSTLSPFPKITTLKLASCKLKEFPDLKNQSKLIYLDLSQNQISGEIPSWIWNVNVDLQYLNLSFNLLEGLQKPYRIILPNLRVLDLHANLLSGNIPTLPAYASYIDFSSNNFTSLPENIGDYLSSTMFFSLSSNGLTGAIPKSVCNAADYMLVLDLSKNGLSGEIPRCLIGSMVYLGVLNLRGNMLSGNIPDAFPSNCLLETIDVNGNKLEGKIPRSLAWCKRLEILNLGNNHINDSFPFSLKHIASLRVLVLRSNKFHGKIGCPANKVSWPKLQVVDIANNSFNGTLPKKCLKMWEAMMVEDEARISGKHIQFEVLRLSGHYYMDSITVINKGLMMELVKILTLFTFIDLSCNKFEGPIPDVIGEFKALYALNLSHNALSGKIPPSLVNLQQLESLDLSSNELNGSIPQQLLNLTFLEVLNLSYNKLQGSIPAGKQFETFGIYSYEGNEGLCGKPLTKLCNEANHSQDSRPDAVEKTQNDEFDWQFMFIGVGFGVGAAIFVAPLMFWKTASEWIDGNVNKFLAEMLPKMGLIYTRPGYAKVEADENLEDDKEDDDSGEESNEKTEEFRGRYCVFCSKLDRTRKKAVHELSCICHDSPSLSPSSSISSTFSHN